MRIYVDTCVLPAKRGLRSGFVSLAVALARRNEHFLVVPALVVEEYRNMRLTSAREAVAKLRTALKASYDHLDMPAVYVPSPEEVVDPIIAELEGVATVVDTHPEDAMEALRREATRTAPARDGRGARDAAIWLTPVRDHRASGDDGVFVTKNVDDFGDPSNPQMPHPRLLEDLGEDAKRFRIVLSPFDFLEEMAPKAVEPPGLAGRIAADPGLPADLHEAVHSFLSGASRDRPADRFEMPLQVEAIRDARILAAHAIDDSRLVRSELAVATTDVDFVCRCWIEADLDGIRLVDIEAVRGAETRRE